MKIVTATTVMDLTQKVCFQLSPTEIENTGENNDTVDMDEFWKTKCG
jgi:hypothetical protein